MIGLDELGRMNIPKEGQAVEIKLVAVVDLVRLNDRHDHQVLFC